MTSIGESAFYRCSGLTSVTIPDSVTSIGYSAFNGCSSLTSITIPDSVTSIGSEAFRYCYNLTSVIIPNNVVNIGVLAFYECNNLTNVFYKGTAEDWSSIIIGESALSSVIDLYYFTESEPADDGNYWHYDTDGKTPVIWEKRK